MFENAAAAGSYLTRLSARQQDDGGDLSAVLDRAAYVVRHPASSLDHQEASRRAWRFNGDGDAIRQTQTELPWPKTGSGHR